MGKKRKQNVHEGALVNGDMHNSPKKKIKCNEDGEFDEEVEVCPDIDNMFDEEGSEFGAKESLALSDWGSADLDTLLGNVENEIPQNDTSKYSTALEKISWENVKFGCHSAEDCKQATHRLINQTRRYRTLREMLPDIKVTAKNPFQNQRTGRITHPDKPKKPMTPYLRYFTEKRAAYKEANPDLNPTELSKFMATQFSQLSEKKRAKYRRKYDAEMAEYRDKLTQFRADHPNFFPKASNNSAKAAHVGPEKPKKPFQIYLASRLKKFNDQDLKTASEAIKLAWNNLSESKQMKWIKKSLKDQARYESELAEYCQEHPLFEPPKIRSTLNKSESKLNDKAEGRPERPPASGYILYSRIMMSELTDVPAKEKVVMIAKRWKELTEAERAKYNAKAQKCQSKYVEKFDAYLQQLPEEKREHVLAEQKLKLPSEKRLQQKKQTVRKQVVLNSAFTYFQTQELMRLQRENPNNQGKGEFMVSINKRWEEMANSEKEHYIELAESIKDYLPVKDSKEEKSKKGRKKGSKQNAFDQVKTEFIQKSGQRPPPKNGFTLFMQENAPKFKDVKPTEKMQKLASLWKQLDESVRQSFKQKCKESTDKYMALVKEYGETGQLPKENHNSSLSKKSSPLKGIVQSGPSSQSQVPNNSKSNPQSFLYDESSDDSSSH